MSTHMVYFTAVNSLKYACTFTFTSSGQPKNKKVPLFNPERVHTVPTRGAYFFMFTNPLLIRRDVIAFTSSEI